MDAVDPRTVAEDLFDPERKRFQALVEQVPAVIYVDALDEKATTIYISPQIEALLGFPVERWREDPGIWYATLHPEDRDATWETYMRKRSEGRPWTMEYRAVSASGSVVWIREDNTFVVDDDGRPIAVQGVMVDITRQKRDEENLQRLDAANRALLQAISHDIRGPLSAVLGAATLLAGTTPIHPAEREKLAEGILQSARRMDRILEGLLDFDRIERGLIDATTVEFNVNDVVAQVVDAYKGGARSIEIERSADPLTVRGDPGLTERIVENLVANALKHSPKHSPIRVGVAAGPEGVLLRVEDAGPGIAPERRETIFEPYQRDAEPGVPGTGIGLALVRRFAEIQGGRAWVEDRPGGGASFRVLLPSGGPETAEGG